MFFQNLPQSKYFFLTRRKAKHFFPIMWNRNIFFHKNNTLTTQIQQCNIFFSLSARALKYFFSKSQNPKMERYVFFWGHWSPTPLHTDYDANFRPHLRLLSNWILFKPQFLKNNPSKNLYPFSDSCEKMYAPCQT